MFERGPTAQSARSGALIRCSLLLAVAACTDASVTDPRFNKIGPEGGKFDFADGRVTLVFPPVAVSEEITVTVEATTAVPQSSRLVAGTVYDFRPDGVEFAKPVELTIRYDTARLPSGVQESELRVNQLVGSAWLESEGSVVDTTAHAVRGSINGFSVFAILGVRVESVVVSPSNTTMVVRDTAQLTATTLDAAGNTLPDRPVSWASSDVTVARLDDTGSVTGVAEGTAVITATSEGVSGTADITVTAPPAPGDVVDLRVVGQTQTTLTLELTEVSDGAGNAANYAVRYAISPISWESAGATEFSVVGRQFGVTLRFQVNGLAPATTYDVQCIAYRGTLNVDAVFGANLSNIATGTTEASVAAVEVSPSVATVAVGGTVQLTATPRDEEGTALTGRAVSWTSSDVAAVTVDGSGLVTGVSEGSAVITATSEGVSGTAIITVTAASNLALQLVATGLSSPVFATAPPGDTARLFVVEQPGRIRIVRGDVLVANAFLDIRSLVLFGGEQGLLSMAFHPNYAQNGEFFVNYTDSNGETRVVRYRVSADSDVADAGSAELILTVAQPFVNHNGGLLLFGPDGMLYVGLGDGGAGGDPLGHGQNRDTLLGAILRIDVDGGPPYAIPVDNPFVGDAAAQPEIWAYGFRNPWRFSFDRATGDLYLADVGQHSWEEVNVQPAASAGGENYGWNIMEGAHCFRGGTCDQTGLVLPVLEYSHADGCSIIGGYVYRGSRIAGLVGHYLYADFCFGWVRSFRYVNGQAVDPRDWSTDPRPGGQQITSFGEDARGELYIITLGGSVFRIVPSGG